MISQRTLDEAGLMSCKLEENIDAQTISPRKVTLTEGEKI